MGTTPLNVGKTLVALLPILILSTACASEPTAVPSPPQAPAAPTIQQIPPTAVPLTPTLELPTPTPTAIPVLEPDGYLLTAAELPVELYKSFMYAYLQPDGSLTYHITFFNPGVGKLINAITVAPHPYELDEVLAITAWAGTRIDDPSLGQNALAYQANSQSSYFFFKGNVLVGISSELALQDLIQLGSIIDTRLPDRIELSPIPFPEQSDATAFSKYFNSLSLAKQSPGSDKPVPATTFLKTESLCLSMDVIGPLEQSAYAIYDLQEQVYVQKFIPEHSYHCNLFLGVSHAGQYEFRISIKDTWVATLPFEIQE